jgi:hypothetical protein
VKRKVFHFSELQGPGNQSLLRSLAEEAAPIALSQSQRDTIGRLNHMDLRIMGVWQSADLLAIMKNLTMQVKTDEIKHFFVRLQQ